ncbi:MAG: FtsX-like permease family protein [Endomicrobiia bacterium]
MKNLVIFIIGTKNLFRHFRRSTISILSVAFCVGTIFFFIAYYRGTYIIMMRESFIKYKSAHIQLQTKFFDDKKLQDYVTEKTLIKNYPEIISQIKQFPEVVGVSGRLITTGFFSNGKEKMIVSIQGCMPEEEKNVSIIDDAIKEGKYFDEKETGILIGKQLAELFNLKVGDMCYLQAQTVYNTPNVLVLPVVGIFGTNFYELDKNTVFINLQNANLLSDTENAVNKIFVMLKDITKVKNFYSKIQKQFGKEIDIKTWEYYAQALLDNEKGDNVFYIIFISILLFISISTIMATMYMNVYERTREIATLRALGWQKSEVFKLFMFESLSIGFCGSIAGLILGSIPTMYLTYVGINFKIMSEMMSVPIFKIIAKPEVYDLVIACVIGILSTYLGAFFPSRKATKMIISESLRII